MTGSEVLDKLLQENNGYLNTSDALDAGVSGTALGDFVYKHEFERLTRGLYMPPVLASPKCLPFRASL